MPNAQQLRNRANGLLSGFSSGQRVVVVVAALALLIGGVFFAQWASKPTMVPLYSNLSSDDASAITGKLQSSGTEYSLADGGQTILVPQIGGLPDPARLGRRKPSHRWRRRVTAFSTTARHHHF